MKRLKNFVPVNELTYGNEVESVPMIPVSTNGVHYNPFAYKSAGKTLHSFGRGSAGEDKAREAQWSWLQSILRKRNWEIPDAINTPSHQLAGNIERYDNTPTLSVGYLHPTFGQVWATLKFPIPEDPSVARHNRERAWIYLNVHDLVYLLAQLPIPTALNLRGGFTIEFPAGSTLVDDFKKDPFGTAFRKLYPDEPENAEKLKTILNPPDFTPLGWTLEGRPVDGVWTKQSNHADLYANPEAIEEATFNGLKVLNRALKAFQHLGVTMRVSTELTPDNKQVLTGLTLDIPPDDRQHSHTSRKPNLYGHTIEITSKHIDVTCGFVEDENKYNQAQVRHAQRFLEEFQDWEEETFMIERPSKENE